MSMSRAAKILSILFLIPFILIVGSSCDKGSNSSEDFMIQVDSISMPSSASRNVPFDIKFYGTIGMNGCYSFKTFNRVQKGNDITIESWGNYHSPNGICTEALVTMDGIKLTLTLNTPGIYTIIISEPDFSSFSKQITIN